MCAYMRLVQKDEISEEAHITLKICLTIQADLYDKKFFNTYTQQLSVFISLF